MKSKLFVLILVLSLATACIPEAWKQDPEVEAAQEAQTHLRPGGSLW